MLGTERFARSKTLQARAHELIPGGCHTYAKGDDQYPELAPAFIARGEGCRVWDVDGNEYIEYGMGLRAVTLGHAYPAVVQAVYDAMRLGTNFTRPSTLELECAEALLEVIPAGEMVKFAKNGSDATTAAVRLARAYTGRDMVGICAHQPFFSTDDWFIGTTAMSAGIPDVIRNLTVKFDYNDIASVRALFDRYPGRIACLILEAATAVEPRDGFLQAVQAVCRSNGALLILDEMITGFRWNIGGAQAEYGIAPDLSTFGKGMGNGFSVAALVGKREIMERGGLNHGHERVFLLSTTHGAEHTGLAAALATIRTCRNEPVIETLYRQGDRLRTGVNQAITAAGVEGHFEVAGRSSNLIFVTRDTEGERSQPFRTLFMQELIRGGVLAPSFVISYSHGDDDVDRTIEVVHEALRVYRSALDDGVETYLVGRSVKPVFRTYD